MAELLCADSDDRIPGYEWEIRGQVQSDKIDRSGVEQVVSWNGKSSLDGVKAQSFRVRIIFHGSGDLRLYSIGFRSGIHRSE